MICPRCSGMMGEVNIYHSGQTCVSWSCYNCGEEIDPVILRNRAARGISQSSGEDGEHEEVMAAIRKLPSLGALREVGLSHKKRSLKKLGAGPLPLAAILSFHQETKWTR